MTTMHSVDETPVPTLTINEQDEQKEEPASPVLPPFTPPAFNPWPTMLGTSNTTGGGRSPVRPDTTTPSTLQPALECQRRSSPGALRVRSRGRRPEPMLPARRIKLASSADAPDSGRTALQCRYCGKVNEDLRTFNMNRHILRMHELPFRRLTFCFSCGGKPFRVIHDQHEHNRKYHADGQGDFNADWLTFNALSLSGWSCPIPGHGSSCRPRRKPAELERHLLAEFGVLPWRCPSCDYASVDKNNVERHMASARHSCSSSGSSMLGPVHEPPSDAVLATILERINQFKGIFQ